MPISVKQFFQLCLLLASLNTFLIARYFLYTEPRILAAGTQMHAFLPSAFDAESGSVQSVLDYHRLIALANVGFWIVGALLCGYAAAYRRQNWARLTLLAAFVASFFVPFGFVAPFYLANPRIAEWLGFHGSIGLAVFSSLTLVPIMITIIKAIILMLVFSADARPWFEKPVSA
jgi:hypothetical protein